MWILQYLIYNWHLVSFIVNPSLNKETISRNEKLQLYVKKYNKPDYEGLKIP